MQSLIRQAIPPPAGWKKLHNVPCCHRRVGLATGETLSYRSYAVLR